VPGLGIDPEDVQVARGADGRSGKVALEYARTVKLQPLERYWTLRFRTTREGTIR